MNDFREQSVQACLTQQYCSYTVFILDDSTLETERRRVDLFCNSQPGLHVIRRQDRNGFKAGNLNNALRQIGRAYKYICVLDADEIIPPGFLQQTTALMEKDERLGFVQASHMRYAETKYGEQTGGGIDVHWNYFLPARNSFGFVYFYGHGALLRHQALAIVGGFPGNHSRGCCAHDQIEDGRLPGLLRI